MMHTHAQRTCTGAFGNLAERQADLNRMTQLLHHDHHFCSSKKQDRALLAVQIVHGMSTWLGWIPEAGDPSETVAPEHPAPSAADNSSR